MLTTSAALYPSMRSAPTLNNWMMPFSSVAMIAKLALVRIAFCSAPALSNIFWRRASAVSSAFVAAALVEAFPVADIADSR